MCTDALSACRGAAPLRPSLARCKRWCLVTRDSLNSAMTSNFAIVGAQHVAPQLGKVSASGTMAARRLQRVLRSCHSERSGPLFSCPSPRRAGLRSRGIVATSSDFRIPHREEYSK